MNDAKAAFCARAPARIHAVAKLPMIDPAAAAAELNRAITELGLVGMVCPQHIRDKNLDDPSFDVVWGEAERLGVPVCVHGGGTPSRSAASCTASRSCASRSSSPAAAGCRSGSSGWTSTTS
jgi:predicted TIM-barrel fold metal-dependent hydrolase